MKIEVPIWLRKLHEAYEAISGPLSSILHSIRNALEQSPPELSADISERGIVLTGGGALLTDLDIMISEQTGIPVIVADDPLTCVVKGGGIALEQFLHLLLHRSKDHQQQLLEFQFAQISLCLSLLVRRLPLLKLFLFQKYLR